MSLETEAQDFWNLSTVARRVDPEKVDGALEEALSECYHPPVVLRLNSLKAAILANSLTKTGS